MHTLLAFVDPDEDWQDIFFLVGAILAVIAAALHYLPAGDATNPGYRGTILSGVVLALAVASIAAGLLFLA